MSKNKAEVDLHKSRYDVARNRTKSKTQRDSEIKSKRGNLKKNIDENIVEFEANEKRLNSSNYGNARVNELVSNNDKKTSTSASSAKPNSKSKSLERNISNSSRGTKLTSRDVTSSRVTKIQYFPKKFQFSSHLHENNDNKVEHSATELFSSVNQTHKNLKINSQNPLQNIRPIKKNSETPRNVKKLNEVKLERPRTATLHKSSIVNDERDSPSTSKTIAGEYDDDSYESDFEQYNSSLSSEGSIDTVSSYENSFPPAKPVSVDEERKMDSGNYDLSDIKHNHILGNICERMESEHYVGQNYNEERFSNLPSLSDEGFEDSSKLSLNINFFEAKRKQAGKLQSLGLNRGEELMSMVHLDSVMYCLFDMKSMSYDEFIQCYGQSKTFQSSCQTGDDSINEDTQTDSITFLNKWTQYPLRFFQNNYERNIDEQNGVGNDPPSQKPVKVNEFVPRKLDRFLKKSSILVLHILEQKCAKIEKCLNVNKDFPYSDSCIKLNLDKFEFILNRPIVNILYHNNMLLTVHKGNTKVFMNESQQFLSRPSVLAWNLLELNRPKYILSSSGEISCMCLSNCGSLIFGGIVDGTLTVWDLQESNIKHRSVYSESLDDHIVMYSASHTTMLEDFDEIFEIVVIQSVCVHQPTNQTANSLQICSLDKAGTVTLWSVIKKQKFADDTKSKLETYIILVKASTISLQKLNPDMKELHCYDMKCKEDEPQHLYIASNYGVLHYLTNGVKPKSKLYKSKTVSNPGIQCIETCPFSSKYFLTGTFDGNVILYSSNCEKSLMDFCCINDSRSYEIQAIQWSSTRPTVFYVKDSSNTIYIWDLTISDLYPVHSIPFKEDITAIKLFHTSTIHVNNYLVVATECGDVYLYEISNKFVSHTDDDFNHELKKFLNYINRL